MKDQGGKAGMGIAHDEDGKGKPGRRDWGWRRGYSALLYLPSFYYMGLVASYQLRRFVFITYQLTLETKK